MAASSSSSSSSSSSHFDLVDFLKQLTDKEFLTFKTQLKKEPQMMKLEQIPWPQIRNASREELAKMLAERYPEQAWELTMSLLLHVDRKDLWVKARQQMTNKPDTYKELMLEKFQLIWDTENSQVPEHFYRKSVKTSFLTVKNLFTNVHGPLTVVVQSDHGFGRTTLLRKVMLEWAAGRLLTDKFTFVFFFYVYDMNSLEETSLVELISREWPESSQMVNEIFSNPERILFILAGFTELKFSLEFKTDLCADWSQRQPTPVILSSLLQKKMLPASSLLLELSEQIRPRIYYLLQRPREICLSGFSDQLKRLCFAHFFPEKARRTKAYTFMEGNIGLYDICRIPHLCWIICNNLKGQMERGESLQLSFNTDTAAHAYFLRDLVRARSSSCSPKLIRAQLRSLCALAAEGKWTYTVVFSSEDLRRNGISDTDALAWLDMKFLRPRGDRFVFNNLQWQSFCAALHYLLLKPRGYSNPAIGTITQLLTEILVHAKMHLYQIAYFLVGLTCSQVAKFLGPSFGDLLQKDVMKEIIECLESLIQQERNQRVMCVPYLFDFMIESQDLIFVDKVLALFEDLSLNIDNNEVLTVCSNCLPLTRNLKKLRLHVYGVFSDGNYDESIKDLWRNVCLVFRKNTNLKTLELNCSRISDPSLFDFCSELAKSTCDLQSLSCNFLSGLNVCPILFNAVIQKPHLRYLNLYGTSLSSGKLEVLLTALQQPSCSVEELILGQCDITSNACGHIAAIIINKNLKHLSLVENSVKTQGMVLLCEALKHSNCVLEKLMLSYCGLNSLSCHHISQALIHNRSLTVLDLGSNFLEDDGVANLCETLKNPNCSLQELWLPGCYLTSVCCKNISAILTHNENLKTLKLGNNDIRDTGVQQLCEALKHPNCKLQSLGLDMCNFTTDCSVDLASALTACKTLKSLNLDWVNLDHYGLRMLCEALDNEDCNLELLGLDKSTFAEESRLLLEATEEKKPSLTIQHHPWLEEERRMKGIPQEESTYH